MPQTRTIYLCLGSNVGDRAAHITRAIEALAAAGLRVTRQSSLYATEPVPAACPEPLGPPQRPRDELRRRAAGRSQNWFLNCVLEAETSLMPRQLLHLAREIERRLGRRRLVPSGPRVLDIDILLYGSTRLRSPELELPHPRMAERRFVLVPLNEIAPALTHPTLGKTVAELLAETPDRSSVRRWHAPETPQLPPSAPVR